MAMAAPYCSFTWSCAFGPGSPSIGQKTSKDDYLNALSDEIRNPFKGHLDSYLKPFVIDISNRDEWPGMIGGIKGLDGLDNIERSPSSEHRAIGHAAVETLIRTQ
jgi:hypothetical protein